MDRIRPGDSREPRPQRRRHADDQGGRPESRRRARAAGDRRGRAAESGRAGRPTRRTARSRSTSWPRSFGPILGPFRFRPGGRPSGAPMRCSINSTATRTASSPGPSCRSIAGSLRPLDLDDDEMISDYELEPFNSPARPRSLLDASADRQARLCARFRRSSSWSAGESSLRPARLLLKKYDKGKRRRAGKPGQQAVAGGVCHRPGRLRGRRHQLATARSTSDELRKFLAAVPIDLTLDVALSSDAAGQRDGPAGSRWGPGEGNPGPAACRRRRRGRDRQGAARCATSRTATPRPMTSGAFSRSGSRPPTPTRMAISKARNRPRSMHLNRRLPDWRRSSTGMATARSI